MNIYENLMKLASDPEGKFYFVDHISPYGDKLRVFSYHIASYSDWLKPDATECRGIMFLMDDETPVKIVSRPMQKFFNAFENPITMDIDFTDTVQLMDKADGSLISTYATRNDQFGLKSKTSIYSEQAIASMRLINTPAYYDLYSVLQWLVQENYTVNMEYVSPDNRIVLGYDEPRLIVLNIRHNETGEYVEFDELPTMAYTTIRPYLVDEYRASVAHEPDFYERLRDTKGIEGMIGRLSNGLWYKVKTQWYVDLHAQKDSVNSPKKLVTTILNNNHDDLYALFKDDNLTIERIREYDDHVSSRVSQSVKAIHKYYADNKSLSKKDYAIKGQKELKPWEFGVAMNAFVGKTTDNIYSNVINAYLKRPELVIPEKYLGDV